jgi:hypothetical protein
VNKLLSRHGRNKSLFTEEINGEWVRRTDNIDSHLLSRAAEPQDIICISKNRPTKPSTAQ